MFLTFVALKIPARLLQTTVSLSLRPVIHSLAPLSTFTYLHPGNAFVPTRVKNAMKPVFKCFPTLEAFTEFIGDDPDAFNYTLPITSVKVDSSNCTNLARAIMKNRVSASSHFYWDLKTIMSKAVQMDKVPVLVIRTESMWEDWTSANLYLGQSLPVATFPEGKRTRDFSGQTPQVTKDISEKGQEVIALIWWSFIAQ
jgi:hypothetical protein